MRDTFLLLRDTFLLFVGVAVGFAAILALIIWIVQPSNDICDRRVQNLTVQQLADCTAKLEKEVE